MFESFFSNLSSILYTILIIVIVLIAIYFLILGIITATGHIGTSYHIWRDTMFTIRWLIRGTVKLFRNHGEFMTGLTLFIISYVLFYCALPDWADAYTMQKYLVCLFSSVMISATGSMLVHRKMKWLLRLATVSLVSITAIIAIYLNNQNSYLIPQQTIQPFYFELLALVLILSIIGIALAKKLHWTIKTRRQPDEAYLNTQGITNNQSPDSELDYPDELDENIYQPAQFSKTGENRGLTKVEKAYGRSKRENNSNPNSSRARNREESEPRQLRESGRRRTKKNYVELFPEDQWDENAEGEIDDEDF
jgi:hypothetical protein